MNKRTFRVSLMMLALGFSAYFFGSVVPGSSYGRLLAGSAAGWLRECHRERILNGTLFSGAVLLVWIAYERALGVRRGWVAALLCLCPGSPWALQPIC